MGVYTDFFEEKIYDVLVEEDYIGELKKVMGQFRPFHEALDSFLLEHGYRGNIEDTDEKVKFISEKCRQAGVPVPCNLRKWYSENKRIERMSAVPFQLCFAFELNEGKANEFLHKVCLGRGFDCHLMEEIVYYFALKNRFTYAETQEILAKVQLVKPGKMQGENFVYTKYIVEELEEIETAEELIAYLNENAGQFGYNNGTACRTIQSLWREISGYGEKEGIAKREKSCMYSVWDRDGEETKEKNEHKSTDDSIWKIYLQILGLSTEYLGKLPKDRSLKPILKDNALLHPLAEEAFPDRDGITKILNGEHVSYERIRKLLILLSFYQYYGNLAAEKRTFDAGQEDEEKCILNIENVLSDANYPPLYPGNPYDFLILMAIRSEIPLTTFRDYMRDLYFEKQNEDASEED